MKTNSKNIKISEYVSWNAAFGRFKWNEIKQKIAQFYEMWVVVVLDFKWLKTVTHSFVDELLGAFVFYDWDKALDRFSFINYNDDIKSVITFVIKDRLQQSKKKEV